MNQIENSPVNEWNHYDYSDRIQNKDSWNPVLTEKPLIMNAILLDNVISDDNFNLFRPTREMARSRTLELAALDGREAHQIRQADYEQAKRELTGESDLDRQQAMLDTRW
jgi:hypothetical protein